MSPAFPERILGIDWGEKRIGLAVSDPLGFTAQGLPTLLYSGKKHSAEKVAEVCREYSVKEIVVGLPINMNGTMGPKAKEVLEWLPLVEKATSLPVKTWDERLTSRQAGRLMIEEGLSRKKQKNESDRMAATLILQGYLESKRRDNLEEK